MRATIILAAALALAACKNNDRTDNSTNVDENLTAENIVSNDVTAIDAVTGDAANMAADVDLNFGNLDVNSTDSEPRPSAKPARPGATRKASPEPTSNSAAPSANATTNSE